jgi:hypothetical protein
VDATLYVLYRVLMVVAAAESSSVVATAGMQLSGCLRQGRDFVSDVCLGRWWSSDVCLGVTPSFKGDRIIGST